MQELRNRVIELERVLNLEALLAELLTTSMLEEIQKDHPRKLNRVKATEALVFSCKESCLK
jgi:hypothetical protein